MGNNVDVLSEMQKAMADFELKVTQSGRLSPYRAPPSILDDTLFNLPTPNVKVVGMNSDRNAWGFTIGGKVAEDNIYLNTDLVKDNPTQALYTAMHEREHILQKKGMLSGQPADINKRFDELAGGTKVRREMVQDLLKAGSYLKERYGMEDAYFNPRIIAEGNAYSGVAEQLLYEQFASLGALEAIHKVKLTDDPELRKTVFNTPAKRESFNALVGLRQTRLDSKDLAPYTRVPELPPQSPEAEKAGFIDSFLGLFK